MADSTLGGKIQLVPVEEQQRRILENLFQYYLHDFSQFVDLELNEAGRFEYPPLPLYWQEKGRWPYFITMESQLVGFVLVKRGAEVVGEEDVFDVAEFFVRRGYRRKGIGRVSAHRVWDRHPGHWVVRVLKLNRPAVSFWKDTVTSFTQGNFRQKERSTEDHTWVVFQFISE